MHWSLFFSVVCFACVRADSPFILISTAFYRGCIMTLVSSASVYFLPFYACNYSDSVFCSECGQNAGDLHSILSLNASWVRHRQRTEAAALLTYWFHYAACVDIVLVSGEVAHLWNKGVYLSACSDVLFSAPWWPKINFNLFYFEIVIESLYFKYISAFHINAF